MAMIDDFKRYFTSENNNNKTAKIKVPNGWGRQNYLGKAQKAVYKEQIDLNNIKEKRGWIQAYVAKKIEGIQSNGSPIKNTHFPFYTITYK